MKHEKQILKIGGINVVSRKLRMFTYGMFIVLCFHWMAVCAAESEVYQEEEVVVTATRTGQSRLESPGMTEVITQEEITASGSTDIAEILAKKGFVVSTNGGKANVASIHLDGFSAGQTLVLVNGIPANTGSAGMVDLTYIPAAGIQKIEVVHGPLSALYGSNALGGVVNIITDLTGEPRNDVLFAAGHNATREIQLAIRQPRYGLAIGGFVTDGFRERTEADTRHLLAQYDLYQNETGYAVISLAHLAKDAQVPGSLTFPQIADADTESNELNLRGRFQSNGWLFDYKVFGQTLDYRYVSGSLPAVYETRTVGLDLAGQYTRDAHQFLVGVTLRHDDFESNFIGDHVIDNGGFFLQDTWRINGQWQLVSGLRWDTGSVSSSPVTPRFGVIYRVSEDLTLKLGYGKAFRAPTVNDLYYPNDEDCVGNPNLRPELSERYEVSGEWKYGSQSWRAHLFKANMKDGISWQPEGIMYKPKNIDKMKVDGVILSWNNQFNSLFSAGIRYSWIDKTGWNPATASYSDNLNYFGSGRWTFNTGFHYEKWSGGLDWHWISNRCSQQTYDANFTPIDVKMPDYHLVNLNVAYQMKPSVSLRLAVSNLLDKSYQIHYGYPMPGREIMLSMNTTF